jgi:Rieske Fe-S protein
MTYETTRRTVLLATGATGAVALVAACGGGGDDNGSASTSSPTGQETAGGETAGQETAGRDLAATDEIPVGGGKIFKEEEVVVTQPEQGRFKAFSAICTHQRCTVASVSDGTINCVCHGSKFDIADGSVAHGPATRPLPAEKITVEGNSVRLA